MGISEWIDTVISFYELTVPSKRIDIDDDHLQGRRLSRFEGRGPKNQYPRARCVSCGRDAFNRGTVAAALALG